MASGAKNTASKTAVWIILGLLIVGLAGFGATNFGGSVGSIGKVGDTEIGVDRYVRELNQEMRALSAETGSQVTLSQLRQFGLDRAVLERLVSIVALEDHAARVGLSIGDIRVRDQVLSIAAFQGVDGGFDREAYRFALQQAGLSEAEFEESLRAEVARTLLQGAIGTGMAAPAVLTDTIVDYIGERRSAAWVRLTADDLDAPIPDPSEADLRARYDANPDAYMLPETRRIAYAWLTPEMIVDTVQIDEDALRALYEARRDEFNRPERRLVERLVFGTLDAAQAARNRLDAGETSFDALVAERGLDLADIDLGDVTEAGLGPAGPAVFAAEGPGVVGPVETSLGPALIRINAILAAQSTSYDEARPELLDAYALDRARRVIADKIEAVDDLLAGGATVEELGRETEMRAGTLDWAQGDSDGIAAYDAFRQAAAAAQIGDFPEVLELDDGGIFALRLDEVIAPRPEPFDQARAQVRADWIAAETLAALGRQASALAGRVATGADLAEQGLPLESETALTRESFLPGAPENFVPEIFEMEPGDIRVIEGAAQAFVVRLDGVQPPDLDDPDLAARRETLIRATRQGLGQDALQAFVAAIETEAGITLDQAAINAVHAQFP